MLLLRLEKQNHLPDILRKQWVPLTSLLLELALLLAFGFFLFLLDSFIFAEGLKADASDILECLAVRGGFGHLEVEEPLQSNNPRPLFVLIFGAQDQGILAALDLERGRRHILALFYVRLDPLDLFNLQDICHLFPLLVGEGEQEVGGENDPSVPPLLQKLGPLFEKSRAHEVLINLYLYRLWVHQFIMPSPIDDKY